MFIVLLSIPDSAIEKKGLPAVNTGQDLISSMYTFRFLFALIFLTAATGVVVKVLQKIKVNYMFIFELDPQYKITHI